MPSNTKSSGRRNITRRNAARQEFFGLCRVLERVVENKKVSKVMSRDLLREIKTVLHRTHAISFLHVA
jgi:hypothetical protein